MLPSQIVKTKGESGSYRVKPNGPKIKFENLRGGTKETAGINREKTNTARVNLDLSRFLM